MSISLSPSPKKASGRQKPRRGPVGRVQRRVEARKNAALEKAARKATPPAAVLMGGLALQGLHSALRLPQLPDLPYTELAAGALIGVYGLRAADAIRSRHDGGAAAVRRRRKFQGEASRSEIRGHMSLAAARERAKVTRPCAGGSTRGLPPAEAGVVLGKARGQILMASHEDVVAAFAPPRGGKTTTLIAPAVRNAPGACVASSTRVDLYEHTAAGRGDPLVLNPGGDGHIPTNVRWSPLQDCGIPSVAIETAGYLQHAAPSDKSGKDAHWDAEGADLVRKALHAAALMDGATMLDAAAWVRDPSSAAFAAALDCSPAPGWAEELDMLRHRGGDYIHGVIGSANGALRWMADPVMAAIACPRGDALDLAEFIAAGRTLYMIGTDRPHNSLAGYYAALTARLFDTAKRMASVSPGSRLDPPLTLALDEPAITCPVPLDRWSSEAGGHGISIVTGFQSRSQMSDRWGEHGGKTLGNNATVKLIYGGFTDEDDLKALSEICGTRDTWHHVVNPDGTRTRQPASEPLYPPERIRLIPKGKVLVLHRNSRPVMASVIPVWKMPGYQRAPLGTGFRLPEPAYQAIEAPHEAVAVDAAPQHSVLAGPEDAPVPAQVPDIIPARAEESLSTLLREEAS